MSLEDREDVRRAREELMRLAEQRLQTYFTRLFQDPSYDHEDQEQDLALVRRKRKERGETLARGEGRKL